MDSTSGACQQGPYDSETKLENAGCRNSGEMTEHHSRQGRDDLQDM